MDPFTISRLAASIIKLIDITVKAVKYLNDIKGAPKVRQKLALEAANLLTLLTSLAYQLEETKATDPWLSCLHSLDENNGLPDQLSEAMKTLVKKN